MELLRPLQIEVEPHPPPDLRRVVRAAGGSRRGGGCPCSTLDRDRRWRGVLTLTRARRSEEEAELLREATRAATSAP
jgi:hypothetical protein